MLIAFVVPSLGAALLFIVAVIVAAVLVNIVKTNIGLEPWAIQLITLVVVILAVVYALRLFGVIGV